MKRVDGWDFFKYLNDNVNVYMSETLFKELDHMIIGQVYGIKQLESTSVNIIRRTMKYEEN